MKAVEASLVVEIGVVPATVAATLVASKIFQCKVIIFS